MNLSANNQQSRRWNFWAAICFAAGKLLLGDFPAEGATLYVDLNNSTPAAPYASWATAATNIQDAVDAAAVRDEILVANGVYETGARAEAGNSNRVLVTKVLTIRSVNGPTETIIRGYKPSGGVVDTSSIRCVSLAWGAGLSGFTLRDGATTGSGGGAFGGILTNCVITGNVAKNDGGGANASILLNCVVTKNEAGRYGGGFALGGVSGSTIAFNTAEFSGGGGYQGAMTNTVVYGNSAASGGGTYKAFAVACTIVGNSAVRYGGGTYSGSSRGCIVYYNTAREGSDSYETTLVASCSPTAQGLSNIQEDPQLASVSHISELSPCRGKGAHGFVNPLDIDGEPRNTPPSIGCDEYWSETATGNLDVAVSAPLSNAIPDAPLQFFGSIKGRLSASSWDFGDGTIVSNRPYASHAFAANGEYEVVLRAYNATHPLGVASTVLVQVISQPIHYAAIDSAAPLWPFNSWSTAATNIQDAVDAVNAAGALVLVSNGVYQSEARLMNGMSNRLTVMKPVSIRSVNGPDVTTIKGYQSPGSQNGSDAIRCVFMCDGSVLSGFTLKNGATQVSGSREKRMSGGGAWCGVTAVLTNCILRENTALYDGAGAYQGLLDNCTLSGNSAFGGGGAAYAVLNHCMLATNTARAEGGGAVVSTLNDCSVIGNSASAIDGGGGLFWAVANRCMIIGNSAQVGGGISESTASNSIIQSNSVTAYGGGAYSSVLNNCTVVGNAVDGTWGSSNLNCILYYNAGPANYTGGTLNMCCTTPLAASGAEGNFTNAPLFLDDNGSDLRLHPASPCINAGGNAFVSGGSDITGNLRIAGGTVDVGAYEFQSPQTEISYLWLQFFGLPADGSADDLDIDGDSLTTWQEWKAGTDPTESTSVLRLYQPVITTNTILLSWTSISNRNYFVERATDSLSSFSIWKTNIQGLANVTSVSASNMDLVPAAFYRIGVSR